MIGYGHQSIDESDIEAVVSVLRSHSLTQGPAVERFESALCEYTGARYAVAVNSGTAALYAAYAAAGVGPGRRLWTSPVTFVATVNAALMLGAEVDYVDVDPLSGNMSVPALSERLCEAQAADRLPDVVVPVHLTGRPCDLYAIHQLSHQYGFQVIEDASHALGARYEDEPVGCCRYSRAATFSFHPVKSITSGEGGAILTNDPELAEIARELRHHGITRNPARFQLSEQPSFHYEQQRLGFNFRMPDILAALGASQLKRLDGFIGARRELVGKYEVELSGCEDLRLPLASEGSAWHLYAVQCQDRKARNRLYEALLGAGIQAAVHYPPVYQQPWHQEQCLTSGALPVCGGAERYSERTLSLPLYPELDQGALHRIANLIKMHLTADAA